MNIIKEVEKLFKENEEDIRHLTSQLKNMPEGTVIIYSKNNCAEYYQQKGGKESPIRKYIPKKNLALAKKLAQKTYNNKCLSILKSEQEVLKYILNKYSPEHKYLLYEKMSKERKQLVEPIVPPAQKAYEKWLNEPYSPYDAYDENRRFQTDRGEMVRSKSEVIIANYLNSQSELFDYRYEQGLWIKSAGTQFHPDFTIFLKKVGRILYHEHFGIMDDPEYANDFTWKYNHYLLSGFIPGRDFIFTCESSVHPFSIKAFKEMINGVQSYE